MQEIVNKISQWLELFRQKIESHEDLAKSQRVDFVGIVHLNERMVYNIIVDDKNKTIIISTSYIIDQKLIKLLLDLQEKSFEFITDIQLALLQMNLRFKFIHKNDNPKTINSGTPIKIGDLESIEISKHIFFDGINQHIFFETVTNVLHAITVIDLLHQKTYIRNPT